MMYVIHCSMEVDDGSGIELNDGMSNCKLVRSASHCVQNDRWPKTAMVARTMSLSRTNSLLRKLSLCVRSIMPKVGCSIMAKNCSSPMAVNCCWWAAGTLHIRLSKLRNVRLSFLKSLGLMYEDE
eukprot:6490401-Amphidinium_carterae.6